jgi:hypothetical protein
MADQRRPLRDGYGRPLPHLVEMPHAGTLHTTPMNRHLQRYIEQLLQEEYDALLIHGMYAEVTLIFTVKDGSLGMDVDVIRRRQRRRSEEEP